MKDGKQGVPFDRWLMRIRDMIYIGLTLGGVFYMGFKYIERMNRLEDMVQRQEKLLSKINERIMDEARKN